MSTDIKDRINKLLAMANDARGNEHENEVAMRMAERLMRQHNIELADLEASSGKAATYQWSSVTVAVAECAKPASWRPLWIGFLPHGRGESHRLQSRVGGRRDLRPLHPVQR